MREYFAALAAIPGTFRQLALDWWHEAHKPSYWWMMLKLFLFALLLVLVMHFVLRWV